ILQGLDGTVREVGLLPVPGVEDAEHLAVIDHRYRDDRDEALRLGLRLEVWRDALGGAVVAGPQRTPRDERLSADARAHRRGEALDAVREVHRLVEDHLTVPVDLAGEGGLHPRELRYLDGQPTERRRCVEQR